MNSDYFSSKSMRNFSGNLIGYKTKYEWATGNSNHRFMFSYLTGKIGKNTLNLNVSNLLIYNKYFQTDFDFKSTEYGKCFSNMVMRCMFAHPDKKWQMGFKYQFAITQKENSVCML